MIHFSIEGLKRYRGTKPDCYKQIYKISQDNALTITNYYPMMSEVNPAVTIEERISHYWSGFPYSIMITRGMGDRK